MKTTPSTDAPLKHKPRDRSNSISFLPNHLEDSGVPYDGQHHFSAYSAVHGPQHVNLMVILALTISSAVVRLYMLNHPTSIVFDEVHFGGFASKYIQSRFFFDVHPPLGKLIIAFTGVFVGYDGSFSFKEIGMDYLESNVPYVALRLVPAFFGVLLSPIAYATMRNFGYSSAASILTAVMVTFENALACQSRLILLDSFLIFFTGLTALMWSEFLRFKHEPFSIAWWRTLTFVGISLGLTVSVKWVGLFTITMIGVATIQQLWTIVTDNSIPLKVFYKHFMARAVTLIVVPVLIYAFFFKIHFAILNKSGPGSSFMSPEFQQTLGGAAIPDTLEDIAFGSTVVIRHEGTKGGYLHSHPSTYPGGSKQQQVTCYPHRDANSDFIVKKEFDFVNGSSVERPIEGFEKIGHGSVIRLHHIPTAKNIHSHSVRPVFTDDKDINEVSCYGSSTVLGDSNDYWKVEIEGNKVNEGDPLLSISSQFRLRHVNTGCYLSSIPHKLPEWGFGQQEVICSSKTLHKLTVWRIESSVNANAPEGSKLVNYKNPSFIQSFLELNKAMWTSNNGLKSSHPYDSVPAAWPLLERGISFWRAKPDNSGIYLIGNPFIWYGAVACLVVYIGYVVINMFVEKRGIQFTPSAYFREMLSGCQFMVLGWAAHYLPFFLMSRQLFLHHYLPSLYFGILIIGASFNIVTYKMRKSVQIILACGVAFVVVYLYVQYAPLTYGYAQDPKHCESLKLRKRWDWGCPAIDAVEPVPSAVTTVAVDAPDTTEVESLVDVKED
ncbi:Dolichyl-phosphate-mannose-protein mannosyltransferase-domain-containing protein [Globomyces pollinis-pini]|nr:Dolichyl-phosphate-mannose-protein mannosyltransferase-domain-containing protein [Globomyces pollinis-pini]